jgi:hypothetical protein
VPSPDRKQTTETNSIASEAKKLAALGRDKLVVEIDGKPDSLTDAGLQLVEKLARIGAPQGKIASELKITVRRLKTIMERNSGDNPVRLAWERGHHDFEFEILQRLLRHGIKNPIPLLFVAKTQLEWRENTPPQQNIENRISLVLPQPMSKEQYYASLGLTGPVDSRVIHDVTPKTKTPALPAGEDVPLYLKQPTHGGLK